MVRDAKDPRGIDAEIIKGIVGSTAAGATFSAAALIVGVVADLVAHPHFLEEIRKQIRRVHGEINGAWDVEAYDKLEKLDSAMKETLRLAPGSYLIYNQVMQKGYTLADGLRLNKGQHICISGLCRIMDPQLFPDPERYDALRSYHQDLQTHRAKPFSSNLADDLRWGAGRWACPGRYIATLMSKVILVKLLDEYDFMFIGGKRPEKAVLHEYVFFDPDTEILMKRRGKLPGH